MEELKNIPRVGAGKAQRYGQEFIEIIKRYCEEEEIERPEDMRVRTVPNKSKFKISIIQAVDRQVRLDDIASEKNLDYSELLSELESIVMSGTKINLDYFIREILDEDEIEDIFSYFRETEHDDLEEALKELGDDYDEDDIRLVRIKFLSEMGN